jgi:hypothetical protein
MMIMLLLVCSFPIAAALPAPMAAFIAHNFGTRRSIRDELAKRSEPPIARP